MRYVYAFYQEELFFRSLGFLTCWCWVSNVILLIPFFFFFFYLG